MRKFERGVCAGHVLFPPARRTAGNVPHGRRAGALRDHAVRIRDRIRLHRFSGLKAHAGIQREHQLLPLGVPLNWRFSETRI